jgi:exodeoxyribonuclease-3
VPVVLAGDYNVIPTDADIYAGHHEQANALLQPDVRNAFERLLAQGWVDALRTVQPHGLLWTFWGYLRNRWENDKGMRLDHFLLSPDLAPRLAAGGVSRVTCVKPGASDHAPAWIELEDRPSRTAPPGKKKRPGAGAQATPVSAEKVKPARLPGKSRAHAASAEPTKRAAHSPSKPLSKRRPKRD